MLLLPDAEVLVEAGGDLGRLGAGVRPAAGAQGAGGLRGQDGRGDREDHRDAGRRDDGSGRRTLPSG